MKYAWNLETISLTARRITEEKRRVENQIEQLNRCKELLATALQGDAGIALQEAVGEDLLRMQEWCNMLEGQAKKLRAVGNKCYEVCEETLRGKMSEAEASMN